MEQPFNAPRITPRVGDVYRVNAQINGGAGRIVREGVLGTIVALEADGALTIELPYIKVAESDMEASTAQFTLKSKIWQRSGQIILGGMDSRILPTQAEIVPPAGPFVSAIPDKVFSRQRNEIAGAPTKRTTRRRSLGR